MFSQHRWAFFIPCTLVVSGAFLLSLYYPRTYSASTTFERRNDPIMVDLPNSTGAASFKYFRSTMERDLTSVAYMSDVVDNLKLVEPQPGDTGGETSPSASMRRAALARSLGSMITINTTSPSEHIDIIRLTYTGPDPRIGARLLDEVKKTYIRRTLIWIHEFLMSQRDYFQQALVDAAEELKAAQREDTRLRLEVPYALPEDPGAITTQLDQLDIERRALLQRRRECEAELSSLHQIIAAESRDEAVAMAEDPSLLPYQSAEAVRLGEALRRIESEIAGMRAERGVTDAHPDMSALLAQRAALDTQLAQRRAADHAVARGNPLDPAGAANRPGTLAATMLTPWQGERSRLGVQVATQEARIRDLDISLEANESAAGRLRSAKAEVYQRQDEFADVTTSVAKARQRHNELLGTLARIEPVIKAIEQDRLLQFNEGESARGSLIPVNPKASTVLILAILAGIAAGAIFVILAEVLDHVYRGSMQVARSLSLPVLETIDVIVTSADRRRLLLRRTVLAPLVLAFFLMLTGVTGALAYLSIQQPWTLDRFSNLPDKARELITQKIAAPDTHSAEITSGATSS